MPKDKGRIDWMPIKKKWKAIAYIGKQDKEIGRYISKDLAIARLQKYITTG